MKAIYRVLLTERECCGIDYYAAKTAASPVAVWEQVEAKKTLGLMQQNFRIFNPVYSGADLVSATVRIYPTAADTIADTNRIASYEMTATYDGNGKMQSYMVIEI